MSTGNHSRSAPGFEPDPQGLVEAVQLRVAANRQAAVRKRQLQLAQHQIQRTKPLES